MPRSKNSLGVYRPKYKAFAHFSLVSLSPRIRSRPETEWIRQGKGRLSHPPKTALERSYLTENSCSENRILRSRWKKSPGRMQKERMILYILIIEQVLTASNMVVVYRHTCGTRSQLEQTLKSQPSPNIIEGEIKVCKYKVQYFWSRCMGYVQR